MNTMYLAQALLQLVPGARCSVWDLSTGPYMGETEARMISERFAVDWRSPADMPPTDVIFSTAFAIQQADLANKE